MIYIQNKFKDNWINAIGNGDNFASSDMLIDEIAKLIIEKKSTLIESIRNNGGVVVYNDKNIIDTLSKHLPDNDKLRKNIALLICENNNIDVNKDNTYIDKLDSQLKLLFIKTEDYNPVELLNERILMQKSEYNGDNKVNQRIKNSLIKGMLLGIGLCVVGYAIYYFKFRKNKNNDIKDALPYDDIKNVEIKEIEPEFNT